ncbi:MAG TPA: hypothetical protein VK528_11410 [Flavobacterium sp.]|nr:hypothetical protein [Flavobacterium sp.]
MKKMKFFLAFSIVCFLASCSNDDQETLPIDSSPETAGQFRDYKAIAAGDFHAVSIRSDGTLWTWGRNQFGQIGTIAEIGDAKEYPGKQFGTDTNWAAVSATQFYSFAIKNDGTLWAWGTNSYGQLGIGGFGSAPNPVQVGVDHDWKHVEAGEFSSVALKTDGTLWGWGDGRYCGFNVNSYFPIPVKIGTDSDWKSFAYGMDHAIAIKNNGTLWGWGSNLYSEVGDQGDSLGIRQIGTDSDWKECSAGHMNSGAIKENGTLWMWGYNGYGQIGNGTSGQQNVLPTQVGTDTDWKAITIGAYSCLGIKTNGTLWSWGSNSEFVLGINNTAMCTIPQQRGNDTDWESVSLGYHCGYALKSNHQLWACGISLSLGLSSTTITQTFIHM